MTTPTLTSPKVAAFAAAVRDALADLPREEVDELTDGLEADLSDRAADTGADALGDPVAYAQELRAAAGLPARGTRGRAPLDVAVANARANLADLRANPRFEAMLKFFAVLAPVWWVARAWLAYLLVATLATVQKPLPDSLPMLAVLVGAIIVSVQFGRGKWQSRLAVRTLLIVANVVAAVVFPFVLGWAYAAQASAAYAVETQSDYWEPQGLVLSNGTQVTNVFAYGPDGRPIDGVQLFDQDGQPLDLVTDPYTEYLTGKTDLATVPSNAVPGRKGWNVFPLQTIPAESAWEGTEAVPKDARLPFPTVQPLVGYEAEPEN